MTNKYIKVYYQLASILQIIPVYKMLGSKKKRSYKKDWMIYTINFLFSRGQKFKKRTFSFVEFILATIIYESWNFHDNVRDESEVMNIHSTDCYTIQKKKSISSSCKYSESIFLSGYKRAFLSGAQDAHEHRLLLRNLNKNKKRRGERASNTLSRLGNRLTNNAFRERLKADRIKIVATRRFNVT